MEFDLFYDKESWQQHSICFLSWSDLVYTKSMSLCLKTCGIRKFAWHVQHVQYFVPVEFCLFLWWGKLAATEYVFLIMKWYCLYQSLFLLFLLLHVLIILQQFNQHGISAFRIRLSFLSPEKLLGNMEAMGVTYYIFFFNKYLTNVLWIYFHNKSISAMCVSKLMREWEI